MPSLNLRGIILLSVLSVEYLLLQRFNGIWGTITNQLGFYFPNIEDIFLRFPLLSIIFFIALYKKNALKLIEENLASKVKFYLFLLFHIIFITFFYYVLCEFRQNKLELNLFLIFCFITLLLASLSLCLSLLKFSIKFNKILIRKAWKPTLGSLFLILFYFILLESYESNNGIVWPIKWSTFELINALISSLYSDYIYDIETLLIGTERFSVILRFGCSGIQGITLFITTAIILYLLEIKNLNISKLRLSIYLVLGVIFSFIGNVFRISALIALGTHGHEKWALGSFHSYTGIVLFLILMITFFIIINHFHSKSPYILTLKPFLFENSASPFLIPFVCLLIGSLFLKILTPSWDWWYPLKVCVLFCILLLYIDKYKKIMSIKFSVYPILLGLIISILWVTIPYQNSNGSQVNDFMDTTTSLKIIWLIFKILGSALIIPVIEELAFRGFFLRFLINRDFNHVKIGTYSFISFAISSIVFGILHHHLWAGIISGCLFNLITYYRRNLFDSILCHSVANLSLSFLIIYYGRWDIWFN